MKVDWKYCKDYKDIYNIYYLITKINNNYRLVFDNKNKTFYVINYDKNNEICLKTDKISPNIIKILQNSRIENLNKIIKNIDEDNEKILIKNQEKFKQNLSDKMLETVNFSKRVNSISNNDIRKILGEKIC